MGAVPLCRGVVRRTWFDNLTMAERGLACRGWPRAVDSRLLARQPRGGRVEGLRHSCCSLAAAHNSAGRRRRSADFGPHHNGWPVRADGMSIGINVRRVIEAGGRTFSVAQGRELGWLLLPADVAGVVCV